MQERRDRLFASIPSADACLLTSAAAMRYFAGFSGEGMVLLLPECVLVLTDSRYSEKAAQEAAPAEVIQAPSSDSWGLVARSVLPAAAMHIAYEEADMSVQLYTALSAALHLAFMPSSGTLAWLRARKDVNEIACIERAAAIGDACFAHLCGWIAPGMTEADIAAELIYFMGKNGAEGTSFPPIVAGGVNGSMPHAVPTRRTVEKGELLTLDYGCKVDGYCSDMTRTIAIGEPDARRKELYDVVLCAQQTGLAALRAGKMGVEIDRAARDVIEQAGYGAYFGHGLGHGVGLEIHEAPRLSPHAGEQVMERGMVVTVEPGVYVPGTGGVRIEDLCVVDGNGCRALTKSPKDLIVL